MIDLDIHDRMTVAHSLDVQTTRFLKCCY